MDNDSSPVANSSCDNCCGSPELTVHLPPVDVSCDPVSDKTRKARRKAAKDKHADNWKYCVKTCIHNGKDNHQMVQCHLCQSWVHPECVGEDDNDIIGIWSCTTDTRGASTREDVPARVAGRNTRTIEPATFLLDG